MKRCDKKQLTLWIAGELNPDEERTCRAHLSGCALCQKEYAALREISIAFKTHASSLSSVDGAAELHAILQQKLRDDARAANSAIDLPTIRSWIARLAVPALAAVILLLWLKRDRPPASHQVQTVQTQTSPLKNLAQPPAPTFSNYSSATRRSLEDFDRLLDAQLRAPASPLSRSGDSPITLRTML
jgi:anti-sigma factor RsiW